MTNINIDHLLHAVKREIVFKFKYGALIFNLACEYDLETLEVEQIIREAWLAYEENHNDRHLPRQSRP